MRWHPTKVGVLKSPSAISLITMTADQIHLLRKSFARVEQHSHVAALIFYRRLFELNPSLRSLFTTNIEEQSRKLMNMLGVAVNLTEHPGVLDKELIDLGGRHAGYGVRETHYQTVGQAMLDMLAEVLAQEFTPATRQAWTDFYTYIAETMKRGAAQVQISNGPARRNAAHPSR